MKIYLFVAACLLLSWTGVHGQHARGHVRGSDNVIDKDIQEGRMHATHQDESFSADEGLARDAEGEGDGVIWEGDYGDWFPKYWAMEGEDYWACGASFRFEEYQDSGDDSGGNGLHLKFCKKQDWGNDQREVTVYDGEWGGWTRMIMCKENMYIDGFKVRYEDGQGKRDDTTLNGLQMHCRNKSNSYDHEWIMIHRGRWGHWKPGDVNRDHFVTGAKLRFEQPCGNCDDTGMNGLKVTYDFNPFITGSRAIGRWVPVQKFDDTVTYSFTSKWSTTTTHGSSVMKKLSNQISASLSVGFDIGGVGIGGEVGTTFASETARSTSSTLSQTEENGFTRTVSCKGSLYQYEFEAKQDRGGGEGFAIQSNDLYCAREFEIPVCPLLFCTQKTVDKHQRYDCANCTCEFYEEIKMPELCK